MEVRNFGSPDETRQFQAHGHAEVMNLDGRVVLRSVFEPGWRWSDDIGPIVGTDSCQTRHFGYCVSGQMKVTMNDGTEKVLGPGDLAVIEPGHNAEVLGDETCVFVDWGDVSNYAQA